MTASERAALINAKSRAWAAQEPGRVAPDLIEDATHWSERDVHTAAELDRFLAIEIYCNVYKDAFGGRPRGGVFLLTLDQIEKLTSDISSASS